MDNIVKKKRGPPKGSYRRRPIYPEKVLTIVRMREQDDATFHKIAKVIGGTRMNACYAYHRWKVWGRQALG